MEFKKRRWTKKDDLILKRMTKFNHSMDEVSNTLQRTPAAISSRRNVLGINRAIWTPNEDELLKSMFEAGNTRKEVANKLKRTITAISTRKYDLGIPGRFKQKSSERSVPEEDNVTQTKVPNTKGQPVTLKAKRIIQSNRIIQKRDLRVKEENKKVNTPANYEIPTANLRIKNFKMLRKVMKVAKEENLTLNITFE